MEELKDIILSLGRGENPDLNGSQDYLYALIDCLPNEGAKKWLEDNNILPLITVSRPRRRVQEQKAIWDYRQPLEPIKSVIAKFKDKSSGCIVEKRNELEHRFPTQSWRDQLDIIRAFLENDTDKDTDIVVHIMTGGYWHHFTNVLPSVAKRKQLEEIKSLLFSRVIKYLNRFFIGRFAMAYLPDDIILENIEQFERSVKYKYICIRLSGCASWNLNRSKLSNLDYLYVMAETQGEVSDDEAEEFVWQWIKETTIEDIFWDDSLKFKKDHMKISLTNIADISFAIRNMGMLGKWTVLKKIMDLDYEIQKQINDEYRRDTAYGSVIVSATKRKEYYCRRFIELAKSKLIGFDITDDLQVLDYMKSCNPDIGRLVDSLGLKPVANKGNA